MLTQETRVFFVTDSMESNEELFETYGQAMKYADGIKKDGDENVRVQVMLVNNAYREPETIVNGQWNYDDLSDTFYISFIEYAV